MKKTYMYHLDEKKQQNSKLQLVWHLIIHYIGISLYISKVAVFCGLLITFANLFDTLIVFLKIYFENINWKKSADVKKIK